MCWRIVVLAFIALVSTTGVIAINLNCSSDGTICELYDVRTNKIEFSSTMDRTLAQKSTKIDIKRSKFPFFPANLFEVMPNVESLRARNCGLAKLKIFGLDSSNNLPSIVALDLENNLVNILDAYAFYQTPNLNQLDLSRNRLYNIDALAFYGLSQLKYLYLSDNQLTVLDQSVFTPLISLVQLFLENNQLQILNFDMFSDNVELSDINFSENKLSTLQATVVNNVIQNIGLSGNQLVDISALVLMKGMQILLLSDNIAVNLNSDEFAKMTELRRLDLDGVDLQRRLYNNYQFLKPLQQLWALHIGRNGLTSLSQFPSFPKLQELGIDGNELSALDVNALTTQYPELKEININNNPWNFQVLTKLLEQLEKMEIVTNFKRDGYQLQPVGSQNKEIIGSNSNVMRTNVNNIYTG
jgi:Leucine-rich repeat (LRR) protein